MLYNGKGSKCHFSVRRSQIREQLLNVSTKRSYVVISLYFTTSHKFKDSVLNHWQFNCLQIANCVLEITDENIKYNSFCCRYLEFSSSTSASNWCCVIIRELGWWLALTGQPHWRQWETSRERWWEFWATLEDSQIKYVYYSVFVQYVQCSYIHVHFLFLSYLKSWTVLNKPLMGSSFSLNGVSTNTAVVVSGQIVLAIIISVM